MANKPHSLLFGYLAGSGKAGDNGYTGTMEAVPFESDSLEFAAEVAGEVAGHGVGFGFSGAAELLKEGDQRGVQNCGVELPTFDLEGNRAILQINVIQGEGRFGNAASLSEGNLPSKSHRVIPREPLQAFAHQFYLIHGELRLFLRIGGFNSRSGKRVMREPFTGDGLVANESQDPKIVNCGGFCGGFTPKDSSGTRLDIFDAHRSSDLLGHTNAPLRQESLEDFPLVGIRRMGEWGSGILGIKPLLHPLFQVAVRCFSRIALSFFQAGKRTFLAGLSSFAGDRPSHSSRLADDLARGITAFNPPIVTCGLLVEGCHTTQSSMPRYA